MASDNNSGCGKIALLLGAIASLVAIIVFLTGKQSLPEFLGGPRNEQAQRTSIPTQQSYQVAKATLTPTVRATDTPSPGPSPTRTPTPTKTPIPSPTLFPNTRPGTILEVGRSWWQDGWELVLTSARYTEGGWGIELRFALTNHKPHYVALRYNLGDAITAVSNQGRRLEVGYLSRTAMFISGGDPWRVSFETITTVIKSGQTVELLNHTGYEGDTNAFIKADIADPALTEIVVTVSGISTITNARWRIPIQH